MSGILLALAAGVAGFTQPGSAVAGVTVTGVLVEPVQATPFRYEVDGRTYSWGVGDNDIMLGFVTGERRFGYSDSVSRVDLRRNDIGGSGEDTSCRIFVERLDDDGSRLAADYPGDASRSGHCDMPALLQSRIANRGAVDLFSNASSDARNIERADFIFDHGALAPFDPEALDSAGHIVAQKRGDSPVSIAAITALDIFGQPSGYGTLVRIAPVGCVAGESCFVETALVREFGVFRNRSLSAQGFPALTGLATDTVAIAFVTSAELGLRAGQRYHGFSLFAADVDPDVHVMTDPSTFPTDTRGADENGGNSADIHGGLAGYFLANDLPVANGRVFLDSDGDGRFTEGDAGVGDIGMQLYRDVDADGLLDRSVDIALSDPIDTDTGGVFRFPGLPDGDYLLVVNAQDPDIPGGLMLAPGHSPAIVTVIDGSDPDGIDFPLIAIGGGGGVGDGSVDAGSGTAGATDAGSGGDAGGEDGATAGAGDAGGEDGATAGAGDAGGEDGATAGAGDAGGEDGATAGTGDAGGEDGATAGAGDAGGEDGATAGAGDAGGGGATDGSTTGSNTEDDESVTAALPDNYTLNQGEVLIAPVLDNDTNAAEGDLTIVAVSESPNATISIVGDDVSYTPDFGFHGSDTFTYTISDAFGTEASAAVSVNVLRFSDINDNGLNDFDECVAVGIDCTDLQLETGVNGSGIGRIGPAVLSLMMMITWRRRRSTRIVAAEARS